MNWRGHREERRWGWAALLSLMCAGALGCAPVGSLLGGWMDRDNAQVAEGYLTRVADWASPNVEVLECRMTPKDSRAGNCLMKGSPEALEQLTRRLEYAPHTEPRQDGFSEQPCFAAVPFGEDVTPEGDGSQWRATEDTRIFEPPEDWSEGGWPRNSNNVVLRQLCVHEDRARISFHYPYG